MALPFFNTMIHLIPNSGSNIFCVSPHQQRKYLPMPGYSGQASEFTNYVVVFKELATGAEYVVKPVMTYDNERETKFTVVTSVESPLGGAVLIENSGLYTYTIWAMKNAETLDLTVATTLGPVETGTARFAAEDAWTTPTISIPDNVVYYE